MATPLDHLRLNLSAALSASASASDRAAAGRWLSAAASSNPGAYCDALLSLIAGAGEVPGTRFLAAVQLKNVISKRWRESSSFSDGDRARLRPLLLSWLLLSEEQQNGIAQIAAVAVSKVARHDWPSSWPELLPELASAATTATAATGDSGSKKRALRARLGLSSVLKELASKRLSSDVRAFRALAASNGGGESGGSRGQLLPLLWNCFLSETRALLGSLSSSPSSSSSSVSQEEAFESWALVLKSARVLLVSGFSETATESYSNGDNNGSSSFSGPRAVAAVAAALPPLTEACAALFSQQPRGRGKKASLKVFKALRMLSEAHPWSLVASGAVPSMVRVAAAAISSDDDEGEETDDDDGGEDGGDSSEGRATTADRVVVQSCLLIKAALSAVQDATPPPKQSSSSCGERGGGGTGSGFNSASSSQRGGGVHAGHGGGGHDRLSHARSSVAAALPAARETLSGPSLAVLADALVSKQLRLRRKSDLAPWGEDPEAWALSAESGAAAWRDSRRGAAEALLSAAVAAEREALAPRLAQRLRETCARFDEAVAVAAASSAPPSPAAVAALSEAALDKEAAAAAATVASYELHDHVSFSQWLAADLARDLEAATAPTVSPSAAAASAPPPPPDRSLASLPRPVAAALARRACLAVSAWVPRASREDRLRCYPPLISALAGGGGSGGGNGGSQICDAAVSLAAAAALRALVDDWDFVEEDFAPFAGAAFAAAARALGGGGSSSGSSSSGSASAAASLPQLADADSHVQVFGLVGVVVDRLPPGSVAAHAPSLMQFLPAVWASGGGGGGGGGGQAGGSRNASSMLRVQCVSLLARLLLSLGDESPAAYSALLPMLSECLSAEQPSEGPPKNSAADLVEDGLGLWLVALRTAPTAWGGPRARPLVAAGCAAAAAALERTSATQLAPLAAAGAGSAALLSCVFSSDESSGDSSSAAAAAAAVEFASLPEASLLCDRLAHAAGAASEGAAMALVASADLVMASVTSSRSFEASGAALSLLQNSLVRLTESVLRGKEGPAVAGGVAALVARVVLAGEESGSGSGGASGGGAALAALASAAAAAAAVPEKGAAASAPASLSLPTPPSLALIDLMLERAPSLPSGARKTIALALAAVLSSQQALPTDALFASVAESNPAVASWSRSSRSSPGDQPPSRPLFPAAAALLAAAVDEFDGEENGAAAATRTDHNENDDEIDLPLRFLFDSSAAESAAVGAAGGDCSALSESVDAEGEAHRRAVLRRRGTVATTKVSRAISLAFSSAAGSRGGETWAAALAALDPRVAGALRAAAERGG